jgi:long-chain fatty acid transport protein
MTKRAKILMLSLCASTTIYAAGYKIPEQSLNSVALSAAYVANANGADASYYNPANMVWNKNANLMEFDLTYINLPRVDYTGTVSGVPANAKSKEEQFLLPTLHFSSKDQGGWRYGLSITAPGGLSKRWDSPFQKASVQEFTLKVIEVNPTFAYKINDKFAIGGGIRGVYSNGKVKSDANGIGINLKRDMTGNSIDFGYNLALSYRPNSNLKLSSTYRSKVDLTISGNASLVSPTGATYDGPASVTIPLPATLDMAVAYTFKKKTTVEFVYERTYWSAYKNLDFNYSHALSDPYLKAKFDDPILKNWKDTNAYRIGITHQYNNKLKLMAGFAIDKSPVPTATLGFELPDADAKLYSVGFEYKYSKKISLGMSYLYDDKDSRIVSNSSIDGTFTHIRAHLLTAAIKYRF